MADTSRTTSGDDVECEECGTADAQPLRVELGDEKAKGFYLCDGCLNEFRAADLIDEITAMDSDENAAVE